MTATINANIYPNIINSTTVAIANGEQTSTAAALGAACSWSRCRLPAR
jgi:hypothetical protein